jgi:hypothetical protein
MILLECRPGKAISLKDKDSADVYSLAAALAALGDTENEGTSMIRIIGLETGVLHAV